MSMKKYETASDKENESPDAHSEVIELKSFTLDTEKGMMCDFNTGICGPENEEKEDEK